MSPASASLPLARRPISSTDSVGSHRRMWFWYMCRFRPASFSVRRSVWRQMGQWALTLFFAGAVLASEVSSPTVVVRLGGLLTWAGWMTSFVRSASVGCEDILGRLRSLTS